MLLGRAFLLIGPVRFRNQFLRSAAPFFVRIGAGAPNYTGDVPAQNANHALDVQDFVHDTGLPGANTSESAAAAEGSAPNASTPNDIQE